MRLVVFGVGYVGLVTGAGLADLGYDVLCIDLDREIVARLSRGETPIYEPGLSDVVRRGLRSGRLRFATKLEAPFDAADVYFVAVGTPGTASGAPDLSAVYEVAFEVAQSARAPALLVVKSTVPVGTCDAVTDALRARGGAPLELASNPEFLKEGAAVQDFFRPDRIVIGVRTAEARDTLRRLYAPLQLTGERIVVMDPRSSELTKYAANALLATRVSFMNELSRLCHALGADVHAVRHGVGADTRIGPRFLFPGPGYGGSCFPKDVRALAQMGRAAGVTLEVAEATERANGAQRAFVYELLANALGGVRGKTVALWGLSFKPETDDVRESPALDLAARLVDAGARVIAHDPEAGATFRKACVSRAEPLHVEVVAREYDALDGAHALVLLTEWRSYRAPAFDEMRRRLRDDDRGTAALVLDGRNVWSAQAVRRHGLRYLGVGTGQAAEAPCAGS
jgi:UDPglucose 6-dehydrogenase